MIPEYTQLQHADTRVRWNLVWDPFKPRLVDMARVKKTSSKKGRINSTRYGKKFKRKYQKKKDYKIEM